MIIYYVESIDGTKLFSFTRHDYKEYKDKDGNYMMIDGGEEYIRYSVDPNVILSWINESQIQDVIEDIRKQFKWGSVYDINMKRLPKIKYDFIKNLTLDHIKNIIKYMKYNTTNKDSLVANIFKEEIKYRKRNK